MFRPKTVYCVLAPMYYCTKLFGLAPFKISNKGFEHSKINILWSLCFMIFLNAYTTIALLRRPEKEWQFSMVVTDILISYVTQANIVCAILFACVHSEKILAVLESIDSFDRSIQTTYPKIGILLKYRKCKILLILGIAAVSLLLTTTIVLSFFTGSQLFSHLGEFVAYIAPELISIYTQFQFCTIVLCLKQRFGWLNGIVLNTSTKYKNKRKIFSIAIKSLQSSRDSIIINLENIRSRHYALYDISKRLNSAYSIQLLLIVAQIFVTILVLTYYVGRNLILEDEVLVKYLLFCLIQIALAVLQIITLTMICSATSREAEKTGVLLYRIKAEQLESRTKQHLQLPMMNFALQMIQQDLSFNACDIFVLNESLMLSIAGAITTHLVIVKQFENKDLKILKD
ncbi:hypothetical protein FQA39_LY17026 [Lamprigera yunnana]|nr:hypothetical protein FQA39_LY17026 [Lamprigera yunnana]